MSNWDARTIETYDRSAEQLAEYFAGIGPRVADIERGLGLAGVGSTAKVVEIGCGDGRDAVEIVPRVASYEGVDPSAGLLELARKKLPDVSFVLADALTYKYPTNLDVIFAFASLLHVDIDGMGDALDYASAALRPGGIYYMSLKEREVYTQELQTDQYGERMFYYYTPEIIELQAGFGFDPVYVDHQQVGSTQWFTLALQKN